MTVLFFKRNGVSPEPRVAGVLAAVLSATPHQLGGTGCVVSVSFFALL